jgi:hypothetical protein
MALGDGTDWNVTTPSGTDGIKQGDDHIRDVKNALAIRMNKEHNPIGAASAGGEHRQGSACAYIQNAAPTTRPVSGALASAADDGRLWLNIISGDLASLCYWKGNGWQDLQLIPENFPAGCVPLTALSWGARVPTSYIVDSQAAGTEGQSISSGAWRTRRLNTVASGVALADDTVVHNLTADQVTLSAGTYRVEWWAIGYKVGRFITRWRNMTDTNTLAVGSTERSDVTGSCTAKSVGWVEFTIAGQKDFELQQIVETTNGTNGGGIAANAGVTETYAGVKIERLA